MFLDAEDVVDKKEPAKTKLTREEKEEIGKRCKRVLDFSRVCYLKENGYETTLNYYVKSVITLENVCLVSKKI